MDGTVQSIKLTTMPASNFKSFHWRLKLDKICLWDALCIIHDEFHGPSGSSQVHGQVSKLFPTPTRFKLTLNSSSAIPFSFLLLQMTMLHGDLSLSTCQCLVVPSTTLRLWLLSKALHEYHPRQSQHHANTVAYQVQYSCLSMLNRRWRRRCC